MKKIKYIIQFAALVLIVLITSCEKKSEGLSKVTNYAVFDYKGEHFISIPVGSTFTDPGVTATLDNAPYPVTTVGSVDVNTPGVYKFTYTSVNPDGYAARDYRYVGVIAPDAAAVNLEGTYARSTNANEVHVTKIADGLYYNDNVGGAPGFEIPVYFFHTDGNNIDVPLQNTPAGTLECVNETLTETGFQWVVINGNFGTATRVFNRK